MVVNCHEGTGNGAGSSTTAISAPNCRAIAPAHTEPCFCHIILKRRYIAIITLELNSFPMGRATELTLMIELISSNDG